MKKTTNDNDKFKFSPIQSIIIVTLCILILCGLIAWIIFILNLPIEEDGFIQTPAMRIFFILPAALFLTIYIAGTFGALVGRLRGKTEIHHENRQITTTNPYIYYKELPNSYGIGVASLLTNSTLENEKDIVAALLDLCAQKYLRLSKHSDHYVIRLVPGHPRPPLENEAYILDLIREHRLTKIDYRKWYNLCMIDGINLGLYQPAQIPEPQPPAPAPNFRKIRATLIACFISWIIVNILVLFTASISREGNPFMVLFSLGLILGFFLPIIIGVITIIRMLISSFKLLGQSSATGAYKSTIAQHLKRTPKGIEELQKLEAFRAFLAQFSTFVDKNPESVILWDRYLSYAQVFGLAKELMKTGYSDLIDNAAFKIDNIDNITLSNITEN